MGITFEGDVVAFTEQTEEICRNTLKEQGFTNCVVKVETVGKRGDNYIANVKRLIAQESGVNDGLPLKVIAKLAPTIEQVREMIGTDDAFKNEILVYTELLAKYDELQHEAKIPDKEKFKHPICYGSNVEAPHETIILEDLCETGYVLLNRFVSMTDEEVKMAVKDLAKFHALSYVLKVNNKKMHDDMKVRLKNIWARTAESEQMTEYAAAMERETQSLIKNEDYRKRTEGLILNMNKLSLDMHHDDIESEYSAIIQGDCWVNNMMFQIENNKPISVIMLDYQITRLASPAVDFLHLTLNCTDYEIRAEHFDKWKDYYHTSFVKFLSYFNLEAEQFYPRKEFEKDLMRVCKVSFGMSMMMCNVIVREPEDVIDFKEEGTGDLSVDSFSINQMRDVIAERYSKRVDGLIRSYIEFGFL